MRAPIFPSITRSTFLRSLPHWETRNCHPARAHSHTATQDVLTPLPWPTRHRNTGNFRNSPRRSRPARTPKRPRRSRREQLIHNLSTPAFRPIKSGRSDTARIASLHHDLRNVKHLFCARHNSLIRSPIRLEEDCAAREKSCACAQLEETAVARGTEREEKPARARRKN